MGYVPNIHTQMAGEVGDKKGEEVNPYIADERNWTRGQGGTNIGFAAREAFLQNGFFFRVLPSGEKVIVSMPGTGGVCTAYRADHGVLLRTTENWTPSKTDLIIGDWRVAGSLEEAFSQG